METAAPHLAVTVAITRRADPSRNAEMLAWVLPRVTGALQWWLHGRRAPWRR